MGSDFDDLVRGEETRDERERNLTHTLATWLLAGAASMVVTLAVRRPDCRGGGFVVCPSVRPATANLYMLVGIVVAGIFGVTLLWTTRRRGLGLWDRALAWGVVPIFALVVGVAVQIPFTPLFSFPALAMVVTAFAAVKGGRAWWGIRYGHYTVAVRPEKTGASSLKRRIPARARPSLIRALVAIGGFMYLALAVTVWRAGVELARCAEPDQELSACSLPHSWTSASVPLLAIAAGVVGVLLLVGTMRPRSRLAWLVPPVALAAVVPVIFAAVWVTDGVDRWDREWFKVRNALYNVTSAQLITIVTLVWGLVLLARALDPAERAVGSGRRPYVSAMVGVLWVAAAVPAIGFTGPIPGYSCSGDVCFETEPFNFVVLSAVAVFAVLWARGLRSAENQYGAGAARMWGSIAPIAVSLTVVTQMRAGANERFDGFDALVVGTAVAAIATLAWWGIAAHRGMRRNAPEEGGMSLPPRREREADPTPT